ncbi:universal stress protein [Halobaculum gomorrense]|uniref:Nucleotide-binding universal stress protein, UspA family n=1 Tax=Halobaculum gomorrense TaxID=43928 RepID=A0A1M5T4E8_9EURY|nr:universal stress protein [Halobaculum gomorrense]SHH45576.1 Nucleotide-binding universal stress protein, UspA family [Halobaculum gomorrense]
MPGFDTIVVATDGSDSVSRAVAVALDLAERFDAAVHALYVVDSGEVDSSPEAVREQMRNALQERGGEAIVDVQKRAGRDVTAVVREGRPANEITDYAREIDADLVATGTRGRHGENRFLIGSVAERVVRTCPVPVLTVRQLAGESGEGGYGGAPV